MRLSRILLAVVAACALVVGFMPTAHADGSTATYIVELKDGLSAQALIPGLLGSDAKILTKAISGGIATLTAAQAATLESNPSVKSVRLDSRISTTKPAQVAATATAKVSAAALQLGAPWNLDILDSKDATTDGRYNSGNGGDGVTVYVIDTGINRSHTEFSNITVATGYDFVDGDSDPADCDGQGTAVASLIGGKTYGAAKGVTIVPLRVLDCNGSGFASDLISALDYVLANHPSTPSVVDIGLGADVLADLDTAVQNVIAAGITVVVAADFQSVDACTSSPGRVAGAITVSASTQSNGEANGASFGTCVDLYAPGDNVSFADYLATSGMATGSGTAYSAALTAGVAAQVLHANPTWTPAQVWARISALATANKLTIASAHSASPNKLLSLGNTSEAFVKAAYQDFLGRQPTSTELAAKAGALSSGALARGDLLKTLSTSDEWLTTIVTKMYTDTLNRAPDAGGLAGWVGVLRAGTWSVVDVASYFYASPEYYAGLGGNSATTWVTQLYLKLLGRSPDAAGLAQWVQQTNDPRYGRVWVARMFYQSTESRKLRVENLYKTLLFREPDPTGWPYWTESLWLNSDLVLATQLAGSQEYWEKAWYRY